MIPGTGTSFSTPQVAATIMLMRELDPDLSNEEVRRRLRETAVPMEDMRKSGAGRLDVHAAVIYNSTPPGPDPETELTIYSDGLESPWIDASWDASVNYSSTGQIFTGNSSIHVAQEVWGGLSVRSGQWHAPVDVDPDPFESVEFALWPEEETVIIELQLENDEGAAFPRVRYGTIAPGEWAMVSMAMSELNPNGLVFHRVNILESSGQERTYYVDSWRLTANRDTEQMAAK